jgi:hypothetical protein
MSEAPVPYSGAMVRANGEDRKVIARRGMDRRQLGCKPAGVRVRVRKHQHTPASVRSSHRRCARDHFPQVTNMTIAAAPIAAVASQPKS